MTIKYTPEARADIVKAQQYIRENFFNETAADNLGRTIVNTISLLKEQPNLGLSLSNKINRKTDLKYLIIEKEHIAFYRIKNDQIQIIRIINARMDYMKEIF